MRRSFIALVFAAALFGGLSAARVSAESDPGDAAPSDLCPMVSDADVPFLDPTPMIEAINQRRTAAGVETLQARDSLTLMARAKAAEIYQGGELDHELNGRSVAERAHDCGFPTTVYVTEDLGAAGGLSSESATLDFALMTLLASPAHRLRLEYPDARWIGVAAVKRSDGLTVWMMVFGSTSLFVD